jgi:hypothetical protein
MARAIAWLLFALVACMAVHSPHCDVCDALDVVDAFSQHTIANHSATTTPDDCNGVCSCCVLHGLPNVGPVLDLVNAVSLGVLPAPPSPVVAAHSAIFQPPRMFLFS